MLWNVVGDSNGKNNFPRKLSLINTQVSKLFNAVANGSSANTKLLKTQFHKLGQWGGCLDTLLGPLLKNGLPLMKKILKPLV